VKTDWRGNSSYEVLEFPFGTGFAEGEAVFEPGVVIFAIEIYKR
jgi:hypothetical protein